MKQKITWIPSIFITSGGVITIIHFIQLINELEDSYEQSEGFLRAMNGFLLMISGSFIIPLIMGGITVVIGIITIWKRHIALAAISLIFSILMLNWIGCILSIGGAVLGFVMWREQVDRESPY
ncbi:hypothetical protein F9U64_20815 [Gracilibacillus oryzae]|uniref:DUF4064 domain-containing protein n=1 Tax=Gracilibacillus oryzae TaxID=1672701 RepID=A0A7C8L0X6_9BACI|nr:hypothetical protein [Gracilibacillus oryzae]KAB8126078.1 hypothetical protein F9U64_20815 [Gracilibacillus oryzae]